MAQVQGPKRSGVTHGNPVAPHGATVGPPVSPGTIGYPGQQIPPNANTTIPEETKPQVELPPENVYPCGCAFPGTHKPDCMWSLWEQMRDNYIQTKTLMGKFMSQVNTMQESAGAKVRCECPAGCHGTDLGEAMGLTQMTGVTVPWHAVPGGSPVSGGVAPVQSYSVENEARKQMEEQRRIKNTWVQFLNIFDMALDMANDVSKDRWEQNLRRKERAQLEREQRLEEMRRERLERQKGSKPSPPPEREKGSDKKEEGKGDKEPTQEFKDEKNAPEEADKPKDYSEGEQLESTKEPLEEGQDAETPDEPDQ